jgi:Flp pilus assembly protein TadD
MAKCIGVTLLVLSLALLLGACGPDTIFLRPALDTPAQHVKNGHSLLARGKIEAANNEFTRAKSLDAGYAPAYVGLALVQGHRGDIDGGLDILNQARELVATPADAEAVDQGYDQLEGMRSTVMN